MKKNNKGFSLIEITIATLILAMVISAFMSLMVSSANMFNKGNRELDVQEEAQIVTNQVADLLCDASLYVTTRTNEVMIFNKDRIYRVHLDGSNNRLLYSCYLWPSGAEQKKETIITDAFRTEVLSGTAEISDALMAKDVEAFTVDTSTIDTNNVVNMTITYNEPKMKDRVITVNHSVFLRNLLGTGETLNLVTKDDSDYDEELKVVRFKDYNLASLYGVSSIEMTLGQHGDYFIGAGCVVNINNAVFTKEDVDGTIINCKKNGQPYKIKLTFDKVSFGLPTAAGYQPVILPTANFEKGYTYIDVKGIDPSASNLLYHIVSECVDIPNNNRFEIDGAPNRYYKTSDGTSAQLATGISLLGNGEFKWKRSNGSMGYYNVGLTLLADQNSNSLIISQNNQLVGSWDENNDGVYATVKVFYNGAYVDSFSVRMRVADANVFDTALVLGAEDGTVTINPDTPGGTGGGTSGGEGGSTGGSEGGSTGGSEGGSTGGGSSSETPTGGFGMTANTSISMGSGATFAVGNAWSSDGVLYAQPKWSNLSGAKGLVITYTGNLDSICGGPWQNSNVIINKADKTVTFYKADGSLLNSFEEWQWIFGSDFRITNFEIIK